MAANIIRNFSTEDVVIANGVTTSGALRVEQFAGGSFLCDAAYGSNTALTFTASATEAGTYAALYTAAGAAVAITLAAGQHFALPEECLMVGWLKFVLGANSSQEETFTVCLKG